jgi:hypothetical protein
VTAGRAAAVALVTLLAARPASAVPSDGELGLLGVVLIVPVYAVGVVAHEGTHVVAAELMGADTVGFRPWPGRDPATGAFQMGLTRVRGLRGDGTHVVFYLAPKLTDLAMLGGYLAWYESGAYPASTYGQLAVVALATGFWVDFAKDTLVFGRHNDLVLATQRMGLDREWKRLPVRLAFAAASAGLGYVVWRGLDRLFASNDPAPATPALVVPLLTRAF